MKEVDLYTDGACSGNPGPGGWAFILRCPRTGKELQMADGVAQTTNNQMELMAVIRGLEVLKEPCEVTLHADSTYVGQGLSEWMAGWKRNGWRRKSQGKFVELKNADLWRRLDELLQRHKLRFSHVKGHAGHVENERCDQLAVEAYQRFLKK
ncbi:MAG: ribonuclease HI [Planctomycetaceae bacterium]|nr:MAG: ribonuclease HI [Planctomycetaceae bacterium]